MRAENSDGPSDVLAAHTTQLPKSMQPDDAGAMDKLTDSCSGSACDANVAHRGVDDLVHVGRGSQLQRAVRVAALLLCAGALVVTLLSPFRQEETSMISYPSLSHGFRAAHGELAPTLSRPHKAGQGMIRQDHLLSTPRSKTSLIAAILRVINRDIAVRSAMVPVSQKQQLLAARPKSFWNGTSTKDFGLAASLFGMEQEKGTASPETGLDVSQACKRFLKGRSFFKHSCARSDCDQLRSSTGCKFFNSGGACFTGAGQVFCSLNPGDRNCLTKDQSIVSPLYEVIKRCRVVPPPDPFSLNFNCARFTDRPRPRYLVKCQDEDCEQSSSEVGCAFVNAEGLCWQKEGQAYCADNPGHQKCHRASAVIPRYRERGKCKMIAAGAKSLQLNFNCLRYESTQRSSYLSYCRKEDCKQARSPVGCKYMNAAGFCYVKSGQEYCASFDENGDGNLDSKEMEALQGQCIVNPDLPPPYMQEAECKPTNDPDPLSLNYNCQRYTATRRKRYLSACQRDDCLQSTAQAGCKFKNEAGFCYVPDGQEFCTKHPGNPRCIVTPQAPIPYKQHGTCKEEDPFTLNQYCSIYQARGTQRYLRRCQRQDCEQARSDVGCKFTNSAGFCWISAGQKACELNPGDPRCVAALVGGIQPPYKQSFKCADDEDASIGKQKAEIKLNYYCKKFLQKGRPRDGKICADQDCKQLHAAIGCKYMNEKGFCYAKKGQKFCAMQENADDKRCLTSLPEGTSPAYRASQACELRAPDDPFQLNKYCERFAAHKTPSNLQTCQQQDCEQSQSDIGCKFMNNEGFCWKKTGQTACALNATDTRCVTILPGGIEPAYKQSYRCHTKKEIRKLRINFFCRVFERRKATEQSASHARWSRLCADQDCAQLHGGHDDGLSQGSRSIREQDRGCKFLNKLGYCYTERSQMMCATFQQPATKGCFTAAELRGMRPPVYPFYQRSNSCAPADPFALNANCVRYIQTKRIRDLRRCQREDCIQATSSTGCKYMNSDGYCYTQPGQAYCANTADSVEGLDTRCRTDIGALPPYLRNRDGENGNGECRHGLSPLTINRSCQRYTYKHVPRFQRQCGREDCLQIKSVGCKYVNADGFCYRLSGQRFCAENQDDKRCFIDIPNVMHARCNSMRSVPLPPLPDAVAMGLRPGFHGLFYYVGRDMPTSPNLSLMQAKAHRTSDTIEYSSVDDFQVIAPDFPRNYFAGVWHGVFKIERAGEYTFSTISEDGSHVWIDAVMVVDNGGRHGVQEVTSSVRLERGYHGLRADFFKNSGGAMMVVKWKGPDTMDLVESLSGYHFASDFSRDIGNRGEEDLARPLPTPDTVGLQSGFLAQFFFEDKDKVSMLNPFTRTPDLSLVVKSIDFSRTSDWLSIYPNGVPESFAAVFSGVVAIDTPGAYTFFVTPTAGSALFIDGDQKASDEGENAETQKGCNVQLGRGYHSVRVIWFKDSQDGTIVVEWKGPDTMEQKENLDGFHFRSSIVNHPMTSTEDDVGRHRGAESKGEGQVGAVNDAANQGSGARGSAPAQVSTGTRAGNESDEMDAQPEQVQDGKGVTVQKRTRAQHAHSPVSSRTATTFLTGNVTATDTTLRVANTARLRSGCFVQVGSEIIKVESIPVPAPPFDSGLLTVSRGQMGTDPANHAEKDAVILYSMGSAKGDKVAAPSTATSIGDGKEADGIGNAAGVEGEHKMEQPLSATQGGVSGRVSKIGRNGGESAKNGNFDVTPSDSFSTTLNRNVAAADTKVHVASVSGLQVGSYVKVGEEIVKITGVSANGLVHVDRGQFDTAAAAHFTGNLVTPYSPHGPPMRREHNPSPMPSSNSGSGKETEAEAAMAKAEEETSTVSASKAGSSSIGDSLVEQVHYLEHELGLSGSMVEVVRQAAQQLGVKTGQPLLSTVASCMRVLRGNGDWGRGGTRSVARKRGNTEHISVSPPAPRGTVHIPSPPPSPADVSSHVPRNIDERALGVPIPPPLPASHTPSSISYDSKARYGKEDEGEGPSENPFHAHGKRQIAKDSTARGYIHLDDIIHTHPAANVAAVVAKEVVERKDNSLPSLGADYVLKIPPPLHNPENINPHYNA